MGKNVGGGGGCAGYPAGAVVGGVSNDAEREREREREQDGEGKRARERERGSNGMERQSG